MVGAKGETKITEKEGMVVWEISVGGNPTNLAHGHAEIVPVHKNHVDPGTILILENRVNIGTIHVHPSMLTEVWIPQRSNGPTTQLWIL